jgi:hypothetical protein
MAERLLASKGPCSMMSGVSELGILIRKKESKKKGIYTMHRFKWTQGEYIREF